DIRFADTSLDFARDHAFGLKAASPVNYVKDATLCGSLFDPSDTSGMVSGVDSHFFVDHDEPLEALAWFQEDGSWPLGDLRDGCETVSFCSYSIGRGEMEMPRVRVSRQGDLNLGI
ncbi:hypothetical protein F5883DRAFT_440279, partial [Diaporthe sp. PMI_573]